MYGGMCSGGLLYLAIIIPDFDGVARPPRRV